MSETGQERGMEIIANAAMLLMKFGIKSMTMDDIARQLSISKKTLYKYVKDKNDLVVKVMSAIIQEEMNSANEICDRHENAIDTIFELTQVMSQKFGQTHASINYDLQKYHPEAWAIFVDFKENFISDCIRQNLEKGISQGLYRSNLDAYVISKVYTAKVEYCFDGETFSPSEYDFKKIHMEMMRYHIRGIASDDGLEYLKQKVKQENFEL